MMSVRVITLPRALAVNCKLAFCAVFPFLSYEYDYDVRRVRPVHEVKIKKAKYGQAKSGPRLGRVPRQVAPGLT